MATGKVSGISGSVPGVPEGHREGPPTPGGHMGLRGVDQPLVGWANQTHKAHAARKVGKEKTLKRGEDSK